jgi:hypothetical protein
MAKLIRYLLLNILLFSVIYCLQLDDTQEYCSFRSDSKSTQPIECLPDQCTPFQVKFSRSGR